MNLQTENYLIACAVSMVISAHIHWLYTSWFGMSDFVKPHELRRCQMEGRNRDSRLRPEVPVLVWQEKINREPFIRRWKQIRSSCNYIWYQDFTDELCDVQTLTTHPCSANSMIVDPHTGLLFYSDDETDSIKISKGDGSSAKTIVRLDSISNGSSSNIGMIVQDIKYKYAWIDQSKTWINPKEPNRKHT